MKIIVNVNIDKLVVEGFSQHDIADFSKTLQVELSSIVSKNGIQKTQTFGNRDINTRNILLQSDGSGWKRGHSAGVEVAMSIYRNLVKEND